MSPAPGGDAMTVRFHRNTEAARLKQQTVPRPLAWTLHAADAAEFAARGERCQVRRCRNAVAVVTWRWWRSAGVGRVLLAKHFTCAQHGSSSPAAITSRSSRPPTGLGPADGTCSPGISSPSSSNAARRQAPGPG